MATIDWIILFAYAFSTIGLGWYFGRKQESADEYFVGSGKMNPILIGVSLFATLLSTISYLALPGEVVGKGPIFLTNYLAYPLIYLFITMVLLPVYMRQRVTSAYELLEHRLGLSIRLLGATMFLLMRLVWMSLLVYLTAKAIATMIGVGDEMVPWIVLVTGVFAITYTSLGGLSAVVITDLMQTVLLYGGALLVLGTITWNMGGFGWFPTQWQSEVWDRQQIFSLDPATRVTVFGSMLSVFLWTVATAAGDQVSVQRYMATEDATAAKRAIAIQLTVAVVVGITLGLVGFALLGYYQANPDFLPRATTLRLQADELFPYFIANRLPPIVTGLVVSGLFAAAMSSIDSGVNSITAVVMTDFLERFGLKPQSEAKHLMYARLLAVAIGAIVVMASSLIEHIPGNFMAITNKTANLLTVPIALLFFFALFVPISNAIGVWIATIASVGVAVLIAFSGLFFGMNPETGNDPISFQWIAPCALLTGVVVGLIACKLFHRAETAG
ncbi:sodium:solute symporter family transporter [Allorhodopirellula solitaria]|uniref:Sodium/glucose cotransporter n=1 Tax=Allorhodopirellula solitaria TaxID=2527987 RepID=A0A5C5XR05_9BACT|nr:sodium-coupled permease [Allorhodopirellula solitaria]TWT65330.1 Sodium/glucose cotransporter [Allorhodopirellula solitaria]